MAKLNPYVSFSGNCREAMQFYKQCLGGELVLQTVGEMPAMAAKMQPEMKDHILHSSLISGGITIMASDLNRNKPVEGNTVHLCINCDSDEEIHHFFTGLSAGGTITEALTKMPWGGKYGSLTDQFGKHWVFNFQMG